MPVSTYDESGSLQVHAGYFHALDLYQTLCDRAGLAFICSQRFYNLNYIPVTGSIIMKNEQSTIPRLLALAMVPLTIVACNTEESVSFASQVKPTLDQYCLECHQEGGAGFEASGLDLSSHAGLMKGTDSGPMVIAGDSLGSNLVVLMEGRADPSIKMPHGSSDEVSQVEIDAIKTWINQGAKNN